jgi:uncharacterized membrane protein
MNIGLTICLMLCMFLVMAVLPFFVFLGLGSILNVGGNDNRLLLALFLLSGIVAFLASFGVFMLAQKTDCGQIKDTNRALNNAGIAMLVQLIVLTLVWAIPPLRHVVSNLLPPDVSTSIGDALSYGYFSGFAGVFTMLIGAHSSSVCT